jgi:hypothetical protein
LRANQQQARAIGTRDPGVMRDTATDQYFQEMVAVNQQILAAGVTSVELLRIEWGPIDIQGDRATATTWETWSTVLPDGSTEQSRDRNDYQLVRAGGQWKIQANSHPDEGPSFPSIPNPFAR